MYKASCPGSAMLFGEHSVTRCKKGVSLAIQGRVHCSVERLKDGLFEVNSNIGMFKGTLTELLTQSQFSYIAHIVSSYCKIYTFGVKIDITSELSHTKGFGTSGAVLVVLTACLEKMLHQRISHESLLLKVSSLLKEISPEASGCDVAASIYGGIVLLDNNVVEQLHAAPLLSLIYSGYKTKTSEVIQYVCNRFSDDKEALDSIDKFSQAALQTGVAALANTDWDKLAKAFDMSQGAMLSYGVTSLPMLSIIEQLAQDTEILSSKISGAGLGDCVMALGALNTAKYPDLDIYKITIDTKGLTYD